MRHVTWVVEQGEGQGGSQTNKQIKQNKRICKKRNWDFLFSSLALAEENTTKEREGMTRKWSNWKKLHPIRRRRCRRRCRVVRVKKAIANWWMAAWQQQQVPWAGEVGRGAGGRKHTLTHTHTQHTYNNKQQMSEISAERSTWARGVQGETGSSTTSASPGLWNCRSCTHTPDRANVELLPFPPPPSITRRRKQGKWWARDTH